MITALLVTCFIAITAYCIIVVLPKLRWSLHTGRAGVRPQARVERASNLHSDATSRPRLLKR